MIVGSLVLILSAAGLLAGGLILGNDWMLGGSIVASLLAAVLLYVGARQSSSAREEARLREAEDEADAWEEEASAGEAADREGGFFDDQPEHGEYPERYEDRAAGYDTAPVGGQPRYGDSGYQEQVHHAEPIERGPERLPSQRDLNGGPVAAPADTERVPMGRHGRAEPASTQEFDRLAADPSVTGEFSAVPTGEQPQVRAAAEDTAPAPEQSGPPSVAAEPTVDTPGQRAAATPAAAPPAGPATAPA
ncbi:MAG: hypothetical protein ACRDT4_18780, partial [Micromonosporaceae bacterium]